MPGLGHICRYLLVLFLVIGLGSAFGDGDLTAASQTPALHYLYGSGSVTGGHKAELRVELTAPAPSTGLRVRLASSSGLIDLPSSVLVASGQTSATIRATVHPVAIDTVIPVSATYGAVTKTRTLLIKAPALRKLTVQSKIRAGGQGKIIVYLTGPAPANGRVIALRSNRPSIIPLPATAFVSPGAAAVVLKPDIGHVSHDTTVLIVATLNGTQLQATGVVRNYDATPVPTATASATPDGSATETATETDAPTATITLAPTTTPTATTPSATPTRTPIPTATSTASRTPTMTPVFDPGPITFTLLSSNTTVPHGAIIAFRACLTTSTGTDRFVSFSSENGLVVADSDVNPVTWTVPGGANGTDLCVDVSMTGRTDLQPNSGVGTVSLKAFVGGVAYYSEEIQFQAATDTDTPTPVTSDTPTLVSSTATATASASATDMPTETATPTSEPATATSTRAGDPVSITVSNPGTPRDRGDTVTFRVCLLTSPETLVSLNFLSTNFSVTGNPGVDVEVFPILAGATGEDLCTDVSMTGLLGPANQGVGQVSLRVTLGTDFYYSELITFLADTATSTPLPTDSPTPSPAMTDTATSTLTATALPTATPSETPSPTSTPSPSASPTDTATQTATASATATPTDTATLVPTVTDTATASPTDTPTPTTVPTETPLPTATLTETPSATPIPTSTMPPTETPTQTPTATATYLPTASPTDTATPFPTATSSSTATETSTATATDTPNPTQTPSATPTETAVPSPAPSLTDTPTQTPMAIVTATDRPVPTATETSTVTPTETSTQPPTETPTGTATATATPVVTGDPVSIMLVSGNAIVGRGETVAFQICLTFSPASATNLYPISDNFNVTGNPGVSLEVFPIAGGATGDDLCAIVTMTGRTDLVTRGTGDVHLLVRYDIDTFTSETITWLAEFPTETPAPPTATPTESPTATASPTPTDTATATATLPATATPTAPVDPITITLMDGSAEFPRGETASFQVCYFGAVAASVQVKSTDLNIVADTGVAPFVTEVFNPGQCETVTMTGRTDLRHGTGQVALRVIVGPDSYDSELITFLP